MAGGTDDLVAALSRWAADERARHAAEARSRERWLRTQAAEATTLRGLLVDLAERRASVTLATGGVRRVGRLVGVGRDFVVLAPRDGPVILVALATLAALHADTDRAAEPAGDRVPALDLELASALAALAAERSPVRLVLAGGEQLDGDLLLAGLDVVTLRGAPPARALTHVPLGAVAACQLR